ncbi:RAB6-interacting golgin [Podarcis raffonei]|uniref:RAB6-interacting golgin n=1 Tax=Podarcis raffonei TaxID=65483 RepID=UPI0023295165|nr:RAB6-interacting golgin [Podarcis raffonei]
MAGAWAGFSEQELRRLQGQRRDPPLAPQHRTAPVSKHRQHLQRKKPVQQICGEADLPDGAALSLPLEQRLSAPKPKSSSPQTPLPPPQSPTVGEQQDAKKQQVQPGVDKTCNGDPSTVPSHKPEKKKMELPEKSRWEILQQEQKLMEEKNKRKKALLAKAIAERSKRTQAETVKLKRIQTQLQALDDMVSADIGILRNRIDQASLEYSCARKRYDKAEAEYVSAKLDLQKKTEVKEQLTEHLCTIIQQNELRKANKLEELMQQLDVEADDENLELEIEVERMLQQQEAEAARQRAESQKPAPVGEENVASPVADKGPESEGCRDSETLAEQPTASHSNGEGQAVNSAPGETTAQDGT